MLRTLVSLALASTVAALVAHASAANADEGGPFRLTSPRGALAAMGSGLVIGVPGGRAWGVESDLRALPPPGVELVVRVGVTDPAVREAFVRVAYYASSTGRTRQLAIADSAPVGVGAGATVAVAIEPPAGAVAYRVRVLARLFEPDARSADGAVTALMTVASRPARPIRSLSSRLYD